MSGKAPENYVLHAVGIALIITTAMILFLRSAWG